MYVFCIFQIASWAFPVNLDKVKAYVRIYTLKWEKKWKSGEKLCSDSNIQDIRQVGKCSQYSY